MLRWFSIAALGATLGCSQGPATVAHDPASRQNASPETFTGLWRSVTPSMEFIRLSVASKSSELGVLGTRLTFSGVAWEGGGKIDGDSLVATVTTGAPGSAGVLIVRAGNSRTLRAYLRASASQSPLELSFVRDD